MLVLASSSTTRADILHKSNISFTQRSIDFDENTIKCNSPKDLVYNIVKAKSAHYKALYGKENPYVCADTVVVSNEQILGKAKNVNEARKMLNMQSDNSVEIFTAMIYSSSRLYLEDLSVTSYVFMPFDNIKMEEYLSSNEWKGKAGACMVEGFCKPFIIDVKGYESTAKGLCVEKLLPFLENQ